MTIDSTLIPLFLSTTYCFLLVLLLNSSLYKNCRAHFKLPAFQIDVMSNKQLFWNCFPKTLQFHITVLCFFLFFFQYYSTVCFFADFRHHLRRHPQSGMEFKVAKAAANTTRVSWILLIVKLMQTFTFLLNYIFSLNTFGLIIFFWNYIFV